MHVVILNGNSEVNNTFFEKSVSTFENSLKEHGTQVELFTLRNMDVKLCIGCFECWIKHPGTCIFQDDMEILLRAILRADLLVFCSPMVMGFISALIKKVLDRIIPIVLPYFQIIAGEVHHAPRYKHYPAIALLYEKESDTDPEDLALLSEFLHRLSLNFHGPVKFIQEIHSPMEVLVDASLTY